MEKAREKKPDTISSLKADLRAANLEVGGLMEQIKTLRQRNHELNTNTFFATQSLLIERKDLIFRLSRNEELLRHLGVAPPDLGVKEG